MTFDRKIPTWQGVFRSFEEAAGDPHVFEGDVWLEKIVQRATNALAETRGETVIPRAATTTEYALPFVAALCSKPGQPLRILDFGGGMATSYVPLRAMLPAERELEFVVVENEAIAVRGRDIFAQAPGVTFRLDFPSAPETFDIVHFGSSLHYVDDWKSTLSAAIALRPEYILLADLPAADNASFVTVQNYYGRRIPVRFWNVNEFIREAEALGLTLLMRSRYRGYYLAQDEELPTQNFDPAHRLGYTSQLVFRCKSES